MQARRKRAFRHDDGIVFVGPLVRRIHEGIRPRHDVAIDFERKPPELPGAERFEIRIDLQRIKFFGPKLFVDDFAFYPFTHCVAMP